MESFRVALNDHRLLVWGESESCGIVDNRGIVFKKVDDILGKPKRPDCMSQLVVDNRRTDGERDGRTKQTDEVAHASDDGHFVPWHCSLRGEQRPARS